MKIEGILNCWRAGNLSVIGDTWRVNLLRLSHNLNLLFAFVY